jgi:hypothetical protein
MGLERLEESPYFLLRAQITLLKLSLSIVILLTVPFILPPLLLIALVIGIFVSQLAHLLIGKDLKKMLTLGSTVFAVDDIYGRPKANVLAVLTVEGNAEIERCREIFRKNVINAKESDGKIRYPGTQSNYN